MTDVSTEPVVAPPATPSPNPPTPAPPDPAQAAPQQAAVAHTEGGWPVVPLAVTGANTTTTLLAGAALAGGPIAAMVAATGAVVLGATAAHHRTRKTKPKLKPSAPGKTLGRASGKTPTTTAATGSPVSSGRTGARSGGVGGGKSAGGRVPAQPRRSTPSASGARLGVSGSSGLSLARSSRPGSAPARPGTAGAGAGGPAPSKVSSSRTGTGVSDGGGKRPSPVGQVRALRQEARAGAPSRAERRAGTTAARRQVADARREAKQQARTTNTPSSRGLVGRAVAKGTGAAGKAHSAAAGRLRKARDERAAAAVTEGRAKARTAEVRKQVRRACRQARRTARAALWRSAARFHGRCLLAAVLAGALGVVGIVSTPLGRKLGWAWLQYPGRRLFARLVKQAREAREDRDAVIRGQLAEDEQAAEAAVEQGEEQQIGDTAERPGGPLPTTGITTEEGSGMSGFNFEEQAAEMEAAAQNYEPESAMEILAMVESLPAAMTSIANVMKILAERSDSEFPLEKEVADSFADMFGALMATVAVAEDMGPVFRKVHEADIARHEDPRNGPEAEKGWNV